MDVDFFEPFFYTHSRRARTLEWASICVGEVPRHWRIGRGGNSKLDEWAGLRVGGSLAVIFDVQSAPEDHLPEGANRLITFIGGRLTRKIASTIPRSWHIRKSDIAMSHATHGRLDDILQRPDFFFDPGTNGRCGNPGKCFSRSPKIHNVHTEHKDK